MSRRSAVVEISPSRLELAVAVRRAVVASRTARPPADLAERWPESLGGLASILAGWVAELDLRGCETIALYEAPDAHAGVLAVPANVGRSAAAEAARLALADAVAFPLELHPHDLAPLDEPAAGQPQRRILGVADTETSVAALYDLLTGAGLRVRSLVPAAAPLISSAVADAAASAASAAGAGAASGSRTTMVFTLGEHSSVLAASVGGRVRFVRTFAVGLCSFVDALRRPIQARLPGCDHITLGEDEARALLFACGIPRREDVADSARGIDGASLLPLLQPVLQRCAVEVRQSIRFGLDEKERAGVEIVPAGYAAAIPRLGHAVAELAGDGASAGDAAAPMERPPTSGQRGSIAALLRGRCAGVGLLPRAVREQRTGRSLSRSLHIGLAAAAVAVAANGFMTHAALRQEERRLSAFAAVSGDDPVMAAYTRTVSAASAAAAARKRVDAAMDGAPDWAAVLAVLADRTPRHIRIRAIDLHDDATDGPRCRIRAFAEPTPDVPDAEAVKRYLDDLAAVPGIRGVKLGATGRSEDDGREVQEFEVVCGLVPLPHAALMEVQPVRASAEGGGEGLREGGTP